MTLGRRDLAAAVVVLLLATLCVGAGFWQLHRLGERRARNVAIAAARALPPIMLPAQSLPLEALRDRRAQARGIYDYAHERVWAGRTFRDAPGVALLTPLRFPDGTAVFVDRGWVPSPDARRIDHLLYREGDSVTVNGLALRVPRDRGDVDPQRLRDSLPYAVLPVVIQIDDTAAPHPLGLARWRTPPLDEGPHLFYAIQWFSFAVIAVVGMGALLRKRVREENGVGKKA
jgi:surfeit locus 1 family protein